MRSRLVTWRSTLYTALGLVVVACGGNTRSDDTGGSGAVGGAGGAGGAGGSGSNTSSCINPRPVVGIDGNDTGFVSCDGSIIHRQEVRTCASRLPRPDPVISSQNPIGACTLDEDCAHLLHGHCVLGSGLGTGRTFCTTGCIRDEDCGAAGLICLCDDPIGRCVAATCASDADCGSGSLCTSVETANCDGSPYQGDFACQMPGDKCRSKGDCPPTAENCSAGPNGRSCTGRGVCGRPFLIAGDPRQASIVERTTGWMAEVTPSVAALGPASRAALAEHWSINGLMEHASVAAFARFTLELLALGAPASLVHAAQRALGDEIAHAELCFGLATAYASRTVQPGPLPIHGALDAISPADIVHRAVVEACIGETIAAAEAVEAREQASDPAVRSVLGRIAEDEARHAELGFKFLSWVLENAAPEDRERVCRLASDLAELELERPIDAHEGSAPELLAHGMLTGALRHEVRRAAIRGVILPVIHGLARRSHGQPLPTIPSACEATV
jgi:hypothetical protein